VILTLLLQVGVENRISILFRYDAIVLRLPTVLSLGVKLDYFVGCMVFPVLWRLQEIESEPNQIMVYRSTVVQKY
jgi:hypothetical protein